MEDMHIDIGGRGVHLPRKHIQLKNCFLTILKQELQNDARMILLKYIWISCLEFTKLVCPLQTYTKVKDHCQCQQLRTYPSSNPTLTPTPLPVRGGVSA